MLEKFHTLFYLFYKPPSFAMGIKHHLNPVFFQYGKDDHGIVISKLKYYIFKVSAISWWDKFLLQAMTCRPLHAFPQLLEDVYVF